MPTNGATVSALSVACPKRSGAARIGNVTGKLLADTKEGPYSLMAYHDE